LIRRFLPLLVCVSLATACANIPEQTIPQPIQNFEAPTKHAAPGPTKDAEPISLVRDFILASGNTAAAQAYLTDDAKKGWRPDNQPTIIEDDFSTVPQPPAKEGDPNSINVDLKGTRIGRLNNDKSFSAETSPFNQTVRLAKQDGQWRIAEVPGNGLVVPLKQFNDYYRSVKLYFYDTTKTVLVPDLRYLPGVPTAPPTDVVALLLQGPAAGLHAAMHSALPQGVTQRTNAVLSKNVLVVNLGDVPNMTLEDKDLVAQQVVLSLQDIANTIRLQVEGLPLVPDRLDWKTTDVQPLSDKTTPGAQLPGYVVVNKQLKSLKDGSPLPGPAGNGEYKVESAAQSVDGSQLAVVERTTTGLQLRIGNINEGLRVAATATTEMTRPTWQFGLSTDQTGNEVWTVADGLVIRLAKTKDTILSLPVDFTELTPYGKITELRLSRDGVRVAVVAGGRLYIGAVARTDNGTAVKISAPKLVPQVTSVVSVDWLNQSTVMVATNSPSGPVWRVPVDGIDAERYSVTNLTLPLTSIAAAPSRAVIVTDAVGMWAASEVGQIWQNIPGQGPGNRPFYPG
jgi:hypothetical protein